jgi:predicted O-methyltransferase YrrM
VPDGDQNAAQYQFTNSWFAGQAKGVWDQLIPAINPTRILEIGSYEGASAAYLISVLGQHHPLELHCVDTWEGGVEHHGTDMSAVEARFRHNVGLAMSSVPHPVELVTHKGYSDARLAEMLVNGKAGYFDFAYVDGSHQAPDVLCDAVLAFKLLRVGGILVFDDYLWSEGDKQHRDPIECPKMAIDAFLNINIRKVSFVTAPLAQIYVQKVAD